MQKQPDISESFTSFLRKRAKIPCPYCSTELIPKDDRIKSHLVANHPTMADEAELNERVKQIKQGVGTSASQELQGVQYNSPNSPNSPDGGNSVAVEPGQGDLSSRADEPSGARSSVNLRQSTTRAPGSRSRVRQDDPDFRRGPQPDQGRRLWSADDDTTRAPGEQAPINIVPSAFRTGPSDSTDEDRPPRPLIKQPATRIISQDHLINEVKGIYAGLVMVETKCIEVDDVQSNNLRAQLNDEQWHALVALHRTLLHEHHDFFLASQHPAASSTLQRLAAKYCMPARMWRHGIHSFLELLRQRLPHSLEHMLSFIYLSYGIMTLLYETVPVFRDIWIECLGDLGRYRMAIEDDDIKDREHWTAVSNEWYAMAADRAPKTGRFYHHLAILARPNVLKQLFFYGKALVVPIPFASALESIMTLFRPLLKENNSLDARLAPVDAVYIKAQGIIFCRRLIEQFDITLKIFLTKLDGYIEDAGRNWNGFGYYIAVSNIVALMSYGREDNELWVAVQPKLEEQATDSSTTNTTTNTNNPNNPNRPKPENSFAEASRLSHGTCKVVFRRTEDVNVLPFVHVTIAFVYFLTQKPGAMELVESEFPWELLAAFLNTLLQSYQDYDKITREKFPSEDTDEERRPLPEDYAMKGLGWADEYLPESWFEYDGIELDEHYHETASMADRRKERILWIAYRIAQYSKWLVFDEGQHQFWVAPKYQGNTEDIDMDDVTDQDETMSMAPTLATEQMSIEAKKGDDESEMDVDFAP